MRYEVQFHQFYIMKKTLFSLLALTVSLAHAEQVYTIVLASGEQFSNCSIVEKNAQNTKFSGTDSNGKLVTKEVPAAEITSMNEETAEKPSEQKEIKKGEEKATDATLRLRDRLTLIDTEMAKLTKPTKALTSQATSTKARITKLLVNMDKQALEIAKLQEEFQKASAADFTFDIVRIEDRTKYAQDGKAAYKAMVLDMKQKKNSRKVGGLDKFEVLRERYQGIPEYKDAHAKYLRTLRQLNKKWSSMHAKEEAARKRYPTDKMRAMNEIDNRKYEEIKAQLEKDGEDITKIWIIPQQRNLKMLAYCARRVEDVLRRTEKEKLDAAVGTVPSLLSQYWEQMDQIRELMIRGDLESAEKQIRNNAAYNLIMRLNRELLPQDYKEPIRNQHKDMEREITTRKRDYNRLKMTLKTKTDALDRSITNAESQIDGIMEKIQQALDTDIGENTMEVDKPEEKPAQEASAPQPKSE